MLDNDYQRDEFWDYSASQEQVGKESAASNWETALAVPVTYPEYDVQKKADQRKFKLRGMKVAVLLYPGRCSSGCRNTVWRWANSRDLRTSQFEQPHSIASICKKC